MTNTDIIREITLIELNSQNFSIEYFGYNSNGSIVSLLTDVGNIIGDHNADTVIDWCHESIAY